jgi:hypothetical protein
LRGTVTPMLWVPCDTARHLSPSNEVRYRTLQLLCGNNRNFARDVVRAFPRYKLLIAELRDEAGHTLAAPQSGHGSDPLAHLLLPNLR